ncbi:MAG TPA: DoxX family protein [Candidatus Limnocylindrales bacterium]|nr:DoxX family protein [Candidatus Limnocylindrales bacterium]
MQRIRYFVHELPALVARPLSWLPPLLARIVVGWTFASTGWGKLGNLEQVIGFFAELGIPFPELQAPFVAFTELTCGLLLVAGLATRIAALPLIGTMVVAIATAQWASIDGAAALFGLVETLYIVLFAWLTVAGPGPVSLDALVERAFQPRESDPSPVLPSALRPTMPARS